MIGRYRGPAAGVLAVGVLAALLAGGLPSARAAAPADAQELRLPYREMGMTPREAAAHALSRLGYGARPGEVDRVAAEGVEGWVARQLDPRPLPDPRLDAALAAYPSLALSEVEIASTYLTRQQVTLHARAAGVIAPHAEGTRAELNTFMRRHGQRSVQELGTELVAQKIVRAVHAENTLREVLADFWTNHFYVGLTDSQARVHLVSYERDAVRPRVLGSFGGLLLAATRHPAMLEYLDNAQSAAPDASMAGGLAAASRRPRGLNENLARELMELHTMGVDGGYAQADVVALARILTGWGVVQAGRPQGRMNARRERARAEEAAASDGLFVFRADRHDVGEKVLLGRRFPAGAGYEEGVRALELLARHPSTARYISAKLAARFVSDTPPEALVERLARRFTETDGDIRAVMVALVESREFWSPEARGAKIKSPLELAVSAVRATGAGLDGTRGLAEEIGAMGQPLYEYAAPTGFPDRAEFWLGGGMLVSRINFGLRLAAGQVRGVRVDLAALTRGHEPESAEAALEAYAALLLPTREAEAVTPSLRTFALQPAGPSPGSPAPTARQRVVGALLGSPAFQRR